MKDESKNIVLILVALALFTGATIEYSEGSVAIGILLFIIAAGLISRIKLTGENSAFRSSKTYIFSGLCIVAAIVTYNIATEGSIGTLDSMTILIGASLIAMGTSKKEVRQLGEFGLYISTVFTGLFFIFYSFLGMLKINFIHLFDHYFVLMPTVILLKLVNIPVEITSIETIKLYGLTETMTIVIGGPCSGLYSMFLLVGIVVAYSRIEKMRMEKSILLLVFAVCIAYVANLARVFALYVIAYQYGIQTMMTFHTHLGWILFAGTAGIIMYILNRKDLL
ncbi:archaeosortase C [Methanolobus chelungpuianus]|uniref:Permease of the major facilitator superfamily n=1 Tax=Methanolobus chelungpuianus TaxID=502115 RepID=A0AAE3H8X4_9EURY|nr:archaeosortase C [Methanolobus chelungpuianus]MCQ6962312.1 permease of the major facilitator superfamily [Methanolobus chelungpuianus]